MTRIYKTRFAATGDKETLASSSQPDGKVSLPDGWTSVYQLPPDNPGYKPIGRGEMNGIFNEITDAIGELQLQGGIIRWQAVEGGFNKGAVVYGADMQTLWQSTVDANTTDPDAVDAAGWQKVVTEKTLTDRFTIIYPSGGSEASPANVASNGRYVENNPFLGKNVVCVPEVYFNGIWGHSPFTAATLSNGSVVGVGVSANQFGADGSQIIVQVGSSPNIIGPSNAYGNPWGISGNAPAPLPCRVKVYVLD